MNTLSRRHSNRIVIIQLVMGLVLGLASMKTSFAQTNQGNSLIHISTEKQLMKVAEETLGIKSSSYEHLTTRWQLGLYALKYNNSSLALKLFPSVTEATKSGLPADQILLARARAYFQAGQLDKAEAEYSQIPKTSDFWVISIEERAQTRGRQGRFHDVISDITSLNSPLFNTTRGPETYFIEALSYLKTCQYKKVTESIDRFKNQIRPRAVALTQLSKTGQNNALDTAIQSIKKSGFSTTSYAKVAGEVPERFHLDKQVRAELIKSNYSVTKRLQSRIQALANEDLNQISTTAKKLHFVEAEMLQRVHKLMKSSGDRTSVGEIKVAGNQLQFPYDGESWIDEIDSYKSKVEGCPSQGAN